MESRRSNKGEEKAAIKRIGLIFEDSISFIVFSLFALSTWLSFKYLERRKRPREFGTWPFFHPNDYTHSLSSEISEITETQQYCFSRIENPSVIESEIYSRRVDVYIGLLLHANDKILIASWIVETTKPLNFLTQQKLRVFLSVIEDGCEKNAKNQIRDFSRVLRDLNAGFRIILGKRFIGDPHRIYTLQ
eukprot:jgi/Galph1/2928/GphlegSOOS_G1567.1